MIGEVQREPEGVGEETAKTRQVVNPTVASVKADLREKQVIGFFGFKIIFGTFIMSQHPPRDLTVLFIYRSIYLHWI